MVTCGAQPAVSCEPSGEAVRSTRRSVLVLEADLELDPVFDDLAAADLRARLHDRGLVPTISRMMMTPTEHLLSRERCASRRGARGQSRLAVCEARAPGWA